MCILLCALIASSIVVLPDMTVTPEGIAGITAETTLEELENIFDPENLETTMEHLGEGFYSEATLIYPGTGNELAVVWEENSISQIRIQGSLLKTAEGIGLGSTLADLEGVIGEFEMAGFAWDYEGYADLEGTQYEGLYIRLTPEVGVPVRFIGDEMFSSEDLREYNPVIVDLRIVF